MGDLFTDDEAAAFAAGVGPDWTGALAHEGRYVVLSSGPLRVHVHQGTWTLAGRLVAAGDFPRTAQGGLYATTGGQHQITVAAERGPVDLGREIRRRLLPGYATAMATYLTAMATHQACCDGARALADRLVALSGGVLVEAPEWTRREAGVVPLSSRATGGRWSVDLRVYDSGARIEHGSLSPALSEAFARLLKEAV